MRKPKQNIINGVFISNCARSVLLHLNVNGLLLDTTWKVMLGYVITILMASIGNCGIPVAFAFGPGETKSLYNLHFDTNKKILDIDLSKYIIESDKGTSIEAVCQERKVVHIYCLRHYLASFQYNEFSYSVGLLLKCVSEADYNQAKSFITEEYKSNREKKIIN